MSNIILVVTDAVNEVDFCSVVFDTVEVNMANIKHN